MQATLLHTHTRFWYWWRKADNPGCAYRFILI